MGSSWWKIRTHFTLLFKGKKKGDIYLPDSPESAQSLLECGHPVDLADFDGNTSL